MKERETPSQNPTAYHKALQYFSRFDRFDYLFAINPSDFTDEELRTAEANLSILFSGLQHDPYTYAAINTVNWIFRTLKKHPVNEPNKQTCVSTCMEHFAIHVDWFSGQLGKHGTATDRIISQVLLQAARLAKRVDPPSVRTIVNAVDKHFTTIQEGLSQSPESYVNFFLMYFQFTYATKKYKKALAAYQTFIDSGSEPTTFILRLFEHEGAGVVFARQQLLRNRISTYFHIHPDALLDAWDSSSYRPTPKSLKKSQQLKEMRLSLETMDAIETYEPGMVHYLFSEYGIRHFGRYPTSLLLKQIDKRNERDKDPHIIILYPYEDYNGAFSQNKPSLFTLFCTAYEQGISVRVIEARSGIDILRRLNRLVRRHGKAGAMLVSGHGTRTSIQFGPHWQKGATVSLYGIHYGWHSLPHLAADKYFVPNAAIVLNSCSTGKKDGLARELSRYGFHVSAPTLPTNIISLNLVKDGDGMTFDPEYQRKPSLRRYKDGKLRRHSKKKSV